MIINRYKGLMGSLAIGLYASSIAFAGTAAPSQERVLLTNLTALQGQAVSKADYVAQADSLISQYDRTAPATNRTDRLLQAMTEMKMVTPAQATSTKSFIELTVSAELAAHPEMTSTELQQYTADVTMNELSQSFLGAQFSACLGMGIAAGAILSAAILGDVYAGDMSAPPGYMVNKTEQDMIYATSGIMYGVASVMFIYMGAHQDSGEICN